MAGFSENKKQNPHRGTQLNYSQLGSCSNILVPRRPRSTPTKSEPLWIPPSYQNFKTLSILNMFQALQGTHFSYEFCFVCPKCTLGWAPCMLPSSPPYGEREECNALPDHTQSRGKHWKGAGSAPPVPRRAHGAGNLGACAPLRRAFKQGRAVKNAT